MPLRFAGKSLAASLTICISLLFAGGVCRAQTGAPAAAGFSEEQIYSALVEPALAENGKISFQKRAAILASARKLLDDRQMQELDRRMAPFCEQPVSSAQPELSPQPMIVGKPAETPPPPGQAQAEGSLVEQVFCPFLDRANWFNGVTWRAEQQCGWAKYVNNMSFFAGLDGSKGPEDLGINALMGARLAFNWGLPIWEEAGLGIQVGTAVNFGENAVTVLETVSNTHNRTQSFTTLGVFQRTDFGLNWAVGWDYLDERYWDNFSMSQVRGQIGYDVSKNNEIGVWGAFAVSETTASLNGTTYNLQPINQVNVFWRHIWPNETVTRVWVGVADDHDRFVLVNPNRPPVDHPFVYGADVYVPLNNWISIFGEANFITPNDTGTVTATFGLAFNLGGRAVAASRDRFAPMLPLANNASFAVNLWK